MYVQNVQVLDKIDCFPLYSFKILSHFEALSVGAYMFRNVIAFWLFVTCLYEVPLIVSDYAFGLIIYFSGFCVAQLALFSIYMLYLPFEWPFLCARDTCFMNNM